MHKASLVQSCGAGFVLLSPKQTQLRSSKPVIAIVAVRTGAGKSPLSQFLARYLVDRGKQVGVIRHPMPYGNLLEQQVEKFSSAEDLDRYRCTVEEREEYQPYVDQGLTIFAGVDYAKILDCAEQESDVILWDGGNNDFSFIRPDLSIVVTDALRSGHETTYYPGETNFLSADIVVINKVSHAKPEDVRSIRTRIAQSNPDAKVIEADLDIHVEQPELLEGKKAIVVEDGPTLTHGGMAYGAGFLVAKATKGLEIIDPRPFAVGTIKDAYEKYPHMDRVLPALGYSSEQCGELSETINSSGADVVIDASPARLEPILELQIPLVRVSYRFQQISGTPVEELVAAFLES